MENKVLLFVLVLAFVGVSRAVVPDSQRSALLDLFNATTPGNWYRNDSWGVGDPCENNWVYVSCDKANTTVQALTCWGNGLVGTLPATLSNLVDLVDFDCGSNFVNGTIPASLFTLPKLQKFLFYQANLTGTIPDTITNLKSLRDFQLWENNLTGTIPSSIATMTNLTKLSLDNNQLTGTIPAGIAALSKLVLFSLYNNQLNGSVPFGPTAFPNITEFLNVSCNCYTLYPQWCYYNVCAPCATGPCNASNARIDTTTTTAISTTTSPASVVTFVSTPALVFISAVLAFLFL